MGSQVAKYRILVVDIARHWCTQGDDIMRSRCSRKDDEDIFVPGDLWIIRLPSRLRSIFLRGWQNLTRVTNEIEFLVVTVM